MKKNSKEFFREVRKKADKVVDSVQQFTDDTKEKIEVYQAYKKEATKIKKITSELINLDMPIYGILDKKLESMTYRVKDSLEVNELLLIGKNPYKVEHIHDEIVQIPIVVKGIEHQVDCKVAIISRV